MQTISIISLKGGVAKHNNSRKHGVHIGRGTQKESSHY